MKNGKIDVQVSTFKFPCHLDTDDHKQENMENTHSNHTHHSKSEMPLKQDCRTWSKV